MKKIGYSDDDIFENITYESYNETYTAHAVVAKSPESYPWIIVNVRTIPSPDFTPRYPGHRDGERLYVKDSLYELHAATNSRYTVKLADGYVAVISDNSVVEQTPSVRRDRGYSIGENLADYPLSHLDTRMAAEIQRLLAPPTSLPNGKELTSTYFADDVINIRYFRMDLHELAKTYHGAMTADKNVKGDMFEKFAELLMKGFPSLRIVKRSNKELEGNNTKSNYHTRTGEFDLVMQYDGSQPTSVFDAYDRLIPVECKHEASSASSRDVKSFSSKVREIGSDLGIFLAVEGISGRTSGLDSERYMRDEFNRGDQQ